MGRLPILVLTASIPAAVWAQSAAGGVTYMNARVVAPSLDGRRLTLVAADGHTRTLAVDPRSAVRLGNLKMGDEVIVTARGEQDEQVITALKVAQLDRDPESASKVAAPAGLSVAEYFAARRQRPNPYSLANPMFPASSPKNPWTRRMAAVTAASDYGAGSLVIRAVLRMETPRRVE